MIPLGYPPAMAPTMSRTISDCGSIAICKTPLSAISVVGAARRCPRHLSEVVPEPLRPPRPRYGPIRAAGLRYVWNSSVARARREAAKRQALVACPPHRNRLFLIAVLCLGRALGGPRRERESVTPPRPRQGRASNRPAVRSRPRPSHRCGYASSARSRRRRSCRRRWRWCWRPPVSRSRHRQPASPPRRPRSSP